MKKSIEKIQTKKIGVAGSFVNQMLGNNATVPVVGKGATVLHYTDRSCYEVLEVSEDGKRAVLEYYEAKHDSTKEGGTGHQNWILEATGQTSVIVWRRNKWCIERNVVVFLKSFTDTVLTFSISQHMTAEQREAVYAGNIAPTNVVDGITRRAKKYDAVSIIFGTMDYYYDWSF